ncbi:TfoX/Sxy family protein [Paludisphaera soli]|uniref:TfoX/Sxy family protein n=1 Tax=Paludisphaera soli TaxID=2712865 RepID=UPI0013EBC155|nr:TfoX/Sxy family protein [Paludisphaera soli]
MKAAHPWEDEFAARLLALGDVSTRSMFGGRAIYQAGTIFALAFAGRLYFKVDGESRGEYEARGMGPFRPSERQTLRSYHEVPADVLGDQEALLAWAAEAVLASRRSARRG